MEVAGIYGIPIEGVAGIKKIIKRIQTFKNVNDSDSESDSQEMSKEEAEIAAKEKMWACYKDAPELEWGVITLESLGRARGEVRDWRKGWCWEIEVWHAPRSPSLEISGLCSLRHIAHTKRPKSGG